MYLNRYITLQNYIKPLGKAIVAFSGGIDSMLVLKSAVDALGSENVLAVTFRSSVYSQSELEETINLASDINAKHIFLEIEHLNLVGSNPPNRCYICKKYLYTLLKEFATENNYTHILDGNNYDDLGKDRPGVVARDELKIISPLEILKFTKDDIRKTAKIAGISIYDKPSRPCLLTRFPYNTQITADMLQTAELMEEEIKKLGFKNFRLRFDGAYIRIVTSVEEQPKILVEKYAITNIVNNYGFSNIYLDLTSVV